MTDQQPAKKNPTLMFVGVAVAAVAAVLGVTKDRWMPSEPPPAATQAATDTQQPAPAAAESEQPAAEQPAQQTTAAQPPAAEPPAAASTEAQQPAAEQPETEQSAAQQPAAQPAAPDAEPAGQDQTAVAVGEPASDAAATTDQPAAAPAAEAPAAAAPVPSFDTVRVEKTGEAVIAGRAAPGADVTIMLDGAPIGTAVANADGSFVVVPDKPLPPGSAGLSIVAKGQGETEVTKSAQTVAVIIPEPEKKQEALVAVVSPDQPTKVLQSPEAPADTQQQAATAPAAGEEQAASPAAEPKQIVLDAVDYDPAGNIVFSGKGEPGNSARIYVDNAPVGEAAIGGDGRWSFSGTAEVLPGVHNLRIDSLNAGGQVTSRIEVPFFREENKQVAAAGQPAEKTDAEQPAAASGAAQPDEGRIVIQPGNNLWRIAKVIYGEGTKYTLLYQANQDQIRNPDLIYPGQVFRTPETVPPETIDPDARAPIAGQ